MKRPSIYCLGFDVGVHFQNKQDEMVFYRGTEPVFRFSADEMVELVKYWFDGLCYICYTEVPLNRFLCKSCAEKEIRKWL